MRVSPRPSRSVPNATVIPMDPEQKARYEAAKNQRSYGGWGNSVGSPWGFGSNPHDKWPGTATNVFDVLYPIKAPDRTKNPWGY